MEMVRQFFGTVSEIILAGEVLVLGVGAILGALAVTAASVLLRVAGLYHLARAFGRGIPFTLGLVLFRPLFILILGLGGSEYRGRVPEKAGEAA